MKSYIRESEVLAACLRFLELKGVLAWRNNTGAIRFEGRFLRFGHAGSADILGCHHGRMLAIEVKRPGGKPTMTQRAFLDAVNEAGGVGIVVDDVKELQRVIEELDKLMIDDSDGWSRRLEELELDESHG